MGRQIQYNIPRENALVILKEAIKLARKVRVDELDCSKSRARKRSKMSVKTILKFIDSEKDLHFVFIHRDLYFLPQEYLENGKNPNRNYWDVGFSTTAYRPDYFLFIELEENDGFDLAEKHKLERL